ncbi:hypothetical protein E4U42_000764 [Claviceps africana]|uniref:Uncharacterized protein n=1 Tax=Claviceps africana TaxID=83212 RepID=A0A8K0NKM2_9HYPO|nr:hypothetical protein E4U42_000764 [Claviceps africana]
MNALVTRAAAKRSFSLLTTAQRVPARKPTANWAGEGRRLGKQAAIFFPGIAMLLGWPFLAKTVFDGHV